MFPHSAGPLGIMTDKEGEEESASWEPLEVKQMWEQTHRNNTHSEALLRVQTHSPIHAG